MRHLIFLFLTFTLIGCKSQKEVVSSQSLCSDSISFSQSHRSIAMIDSVIRSTHFVFDTLEVSIERPSAVADTPQVFHMKAVKGKLDEARKSPRDSVVNYNSIDSVNCRQNSDAEILQIVDTVAVAKPPDTTIIIVIAILLIAILLFIFKRKH